MPRIQLKGDGRKARAPKKTLQKAAALSGSLQVDHGLGADLHPGDFHRHSRRQ